MTTTALLTTLLLAASPTAASATPTDALGAEDLRALAELVDARRHALVESADGYVGRNRAQRWRTTFDGAGFEVRPADGAWCWGLELVGGRTSDDGCPPLRAEGNRLSRRWSAELTEWYVNDARGLEHGFTVQRADDEVLRLTLAVRGGLAPEVRADGRDVAFRDAHGDVVITYDGLLAHDADGVPLPASFEAERDVLLLTVDATGARFPVTIDPVAQQAYLKAINSDAGDRFGRAIALSGDRVVVGAPREASSGTGTLSGGGAPDVLDDSASLAGAAYVFVRSGSTWTFEDYLKASNTDIGDEFGSTVGISGDTIVVGAPPEASTATGVDGDETNDDAFGTGAVYVFRRVGGVWTQEAYLKASNASSPDLFGSAVAISGDTILVGAYKESSAATGVGGSEADDSAPDAGAAYVFVRTGATWTQQAYLKASNTDSNDAFGWSVALDGDLAVVGAPSESSAGTGTSGGIFEPDQSDDSLPDAGAAYVFERSGSTWSQDAYLKASNTDSFDYFGRAVALHGTTVLVGAPFEDGGDPDDDSDDGATSAGAAYVFVRTGAQWSQEAYLKASNLELGDERFGGSVALSGQRAVVGAVGEDGSSPGVDGDQADNALSSAGAAYAFRRTGTTWSQTNYLKASNPGSADTFGYAVALDADTVVVGAPTEDGGADVVNGDETDDSASGAGAAYVFELGVFPSVTFRNAGTNPASYVADAPAIGQTWTATVDLTTTGHGVALVVGYAAPTEFLLAGGQTLLVLGSADLLGLPLGLGPLAAFSLPIPPDPGLCGAAVYTQAIHVGGVSPFALSNAQDLVVGY